jgi:hypothetical protein
MKKVQGCRAIRRQTTRRELYCFDKGLVVEVEETLETPEPSVKYWRIHGYIEGFRFGPGDVKGFEKGGLHVYYGTNKPGEVLGMILSAERALRKMDAKFKDPA